MKTKLILRIVEVVIVGAAVAVLGVKGVKSDAYDEYVKQGGERSFWSWVRTGDESVKDELEEVAARKAVAKKKAMLNMLDAKRAAAKAEEERIAKLEKMAAELREKIRRSDDEARRIADEYQKKHDKSAKHRGGSVKTGGKSSYVAGDGRTPYRFKPTTMDRTDNLKSSSILGFTNKGGDTTITGGINAWSDDHFTVTLTVRDKAYSAETKAQPNAAYESGLADSVDARIEVCGNDYIENKMRVNEFLSND